MAVIIYVHDNPGPFAGVQTAVVVEVVEADGGNLQGLPSASGVAGMCRWCVVAILHAVVVRAVAIASVRAGRSGHCTHCAARHHADQRACIVAARTAKQAADARTEHAAQRTAGGDAAILLRAATAQHQEDCSQE